jgi:hypothetical protein
MPLTLKEAILMVLLDLKAHFLFGMMLGGEMWKNAANRAFYLTKQVYSSTTTTTEGSSRRRWELLVIRCFC